MEIGCFRDKRHFCGGGNRLIVSSGGRELDLW